MAFYYVSLFGFQVVTILVLKMAQTKIAMIVNDNNNNNNNNNNDDDDDDDDMLCF